MNTLIIVLIAIVVLVAAYTLYGRWIAKKWGIDPTAITPAVAKMMGKIMSQPTAGPYLHISSVPSLEPVP